MYYSLPSSHHPTCDQPRCEDRQRNVRRPNLFTMRWLGGMLLAVVAPSRMPMVNTFPINKQRPSQAFRSLMSSLSSSSTKFLIADFRQTNRPNEHGTLTTPEIVTGIRLPDNDEQRNNRSVTTSATATFSPTVTDATLDYWFHTLQGMEEEGIKPRPKIHVSAQVRQKWDRLFPHQEIHDTVQSPYSNVPSASSSDNREGQPHRLNQRPEL
jgi:hypothetical protein